MKLRFKKMSGAGNDFIVIDNRAGRIRNGSHLARRLCDRHWGIGADGLILIEPSTKADYQMKYYNADGSYGGMCGNGGRCAALYCFSAGIANKSHTFEAVNHLYRAAVNQSSVALRMIEPTNLILDISLKTSFGAIPAHFVNSGAPHVVVDTQRIKQHFQKLDDGPVLELGREIRYHQIFQPEGTNVNFIEILGTKSVRMRTYERGVEAETLACGTGAVATAIIASVKYGMNSPIYIHTKSKVTLKVAFKRNGKKFEEVILSGPAKVTFEGIIEI